MYVCACVCMRVCVNGLLFCTLCQTGEQLETNILALRCLCEIGLSLTDQELSEFRAFMPYIIKLLETALETDINNNKNNNENKNNDTNENNNNDSKNNEKNESNEKSRDYSIEILDLLSTISETGGGAAVYCNHFEKIGNLLSKYILNKAMPDKIRVKCIDFMVHLCESASSMTRQSKKYCNLCIDTCLAVMAETTTDNEWELLPYPHYDNSITTFMEKGIQNKGCIKQKTQKKAPDSQKNKANHTQTH